MRSNPNPPAPRPPTRDVLSEPESILRAAFEIMPEGMLIVSASGRITHYNRRFLEIWSIPPDHPAIRERDDSALIALVTGQVLPGEDFPQRIQEISRPGERTEELLRLRDGRVLERISYPVPRPAAAEAERVWQFRDITARKQAEAAVDKHAEALARHLTEHQRTEAALQAKTDELDRYFTNSLDLLCIANTAGQFVRLNPEWEKVLGYPLAELLGRQFMEFVHPDDYAGTVAAIARLAEQTEVLHFVNRYRCKDGSYRWIEWSAHPAGHQVYAVARDITERKQVEEALRASEQRFRQMFEHNRAVMLLVDPETGRIAAANPAAAEFYGHSPEKLCHMRIEDINVLPADQVQEQRRQAALGKRELFVFPHRLANGEIRTVEVRSSPVEVGGRQLLFSIVQDITERAKTDAALRQFQFTIEHAGEAVFWTDPEGNFRYVNAQACRSLGYTREELLNLHLWDIDPGFPRERLAQMWKESTANGALPTAIFETLHRRKDGTVFPVEILPRYYQLGGTDMSVSFVRDITRRKQAEADLKASEHRTRSIVESLPLGMHLYRLENDGRLVFIGANPAADRIVGTDHRQFLGKTIEEAFPPLAATEVPARYRAAAATGQAWHTEQIVYRDATIRSAFNVDAFQFSPNHMVAAFEDITERKRTEAALLASERKLAEIFRSSPEMIVVTAVADGRLLELNEACARMLGYTREELLGRTTLEINVWATPAERERVIGLVRQGGQVQNIEVQFRKKNGDFIDVLLSMAPLQLDEQACLITLATDVTAIKQAETARRDFERQLQHTQKLESLGVLAGGIAHDFNNLLMAILGNLDLALLDIPPASPARESIEQSVLAARRAADLTRQMLAYSGKGNFVTRSLDLNALVTENAHLFRACISRLIQLEIETTANLPAIRADAGQIQQVVMNLITNASEAIGDHPGRIRLHTGEIDCDEATLKRSRTDVIPAAGRFVLLEVTDSGCGMDEATQQRLFDPFFTTKFTGRGLGMSAILGIMRAHEGAIFVDSTVGQGSSIRVLFPAQADAPAPVPGPGADRPVPAPAAPPSPGTILIVDDEDIVRRVCSHMLAKQGWRVIEAAEGIQGLELFRRQPAAITCVLLDLSMPNMGGIEVFRAMRLIRPDVRIILTSGYSSDQSTSAQLAGEGLAGFIQKPFTAQTLLHELERALKRP